MVGHVPPPLGVYVPTIVVEEEAPIDEHVHRPSPSSGLGLEHSRDVVGGGGGGCDVEEGGGGGVLMLDGKEVGQIPLIGV